MKEKLFLTGLLFVSALSLNGQENKKDTRFSVNADLYSSYIWRGCRLGKGPAIQPNFKYTNGGLTAGIWGSFDAFGYAESDPYVSYSFPFGLTLGLTDYYFPDLQVFDISDTAGSHAIEINTGFSLKGFNLSANYILNQAGGAGSAGDDIYFQAGYSFTNFNVFIGAGDGWHTIDGKFNLCNIGLGTTRQIQITEKFSIPLTGQVILNPDREQLFVVAGISF